MFVRAFFTPLLFKELVYSLTFEDVAEELVAHHLGLLLALDVRLTGAGRDDVRHVPAAGLGLPAVAEAVGVVLHDVLARHQVVVLVVVERPAQTLGVAPERGGSGDVDTGAAVPQDLDPVGQVSLRKETAQREEVRENTFRF